MAKHRLTSRRTRASLRHTVDILDLRTGTIHLLTLAAAAAGTNRTGRYVACAEPTWYARTTSPIPDFVTTAGRAAPSFRDNAQDHEDSGRAVRLSPIPRTALPGPAGPRHTEESMTRENMAVSSKPTSDPLAYLDQLTATVEKRGRLRWMLGQILTLADDAPGMTDEQLRDRLLVLADRTRDGGTAP